LAAPGSAAGRGRRDAGAPAPLGETGVAGASGRSERRPNQSRRAREIRALEEAIADLEGRKRRFGSALSNPQLYADADKSGFYMRELEAIEDRLAELYGEWERLHGEQA